MTQAITITAVSKTVREKETTLSALACAHEKTLPVYLLPNASAKLVRHTKALTGPQSSAGDAPNIWASRRWTSPRSSSSSYLS